MIRVVVGEDNYIAREGISRALEGEADIDLLEARPRRLRADQPPGHVG